MRFFKNLNDFQGNLYQIMANIREIVTRKKTLKNPLSRTFTGTPRPFLQRKGICLTYSPITISHI